MKFRILVGLLSAGLVTASLVTAGCSSRAATPKAPDPEVILQAIPAPDLAQVNGIRDMKNWRNPYLIVDGDGVALFDVADSAEIRLKTDELLPALAKLPASNWPYGRAVAAAERVESSTQQHAAMLRNRGIIGGMLEGAHVTVRWVQ